MLSNTPSQFNGLGDQVAPLRVMHIASGDLWAGAEVQTYTLLKELSRLRVEVLVVLLNEGALARNLRDFGTKVIVLDEQTLSPLATIAKLRTLIRSWAPHVVHTHRTKEHILGAFANLLSRRAPSVRTAHGAPEHTARFWKFHRYALRAIDVFCGRHLQDRIIAVSDELRLTLSKTFSIETIETIENGLDVDDLRSRVRHLALPHPRDAKQIAIIGRLVSVKRVDLFLRAAKLLCDQKPDGYRFHVIGDGPLRQPLEELASSLEIADKVTFHGHRDDIASCIAAMDVVSMCSDHEGLPMTALETIALGKVLVAHAVGGLVKLAADCKAVQLVSLHTPEGYAQAIAAARYPPEAKMPTRYLAQTNARAVLNLYKSLIQTPT